MLRLMAWNIEWMADHFGPDNRPLATPATRRKLDAVAAVIAAIDPDLIGVTEAPDTSASSPRDTVAALEGFAALRGLRPSRALIGRRSAGRQEIAVMWDPARLDVVHDPGGRSGAVKNPPFAEPFQIDSDADGIREIYRHYRPPLEARVTPAGGTPFWTMVVHAKSKGIFDAMDRVHFDRTSERNRRKLFAECSSIRRRVDEWLRADRAVVVMGDINDGPGFDYYEGRFGRSAVEIVMGDIFRPDAILRNRIGPPRWGRFGWEPSTARFTDRFTGDAVNALIDHVMASRHLAVAGAGAVAGAAPARVWNPFQTAEAAPLRAALMAASDHFPVTLDLADDPAGGAA